MHASSVTTKTQIYISFNSDPIFFLFISVQKAIVKDIHENKTSFQCNLCTKSFANKKYLKGHVKGTHENAKSYDCISCQKRLTTYTG